ncbi:hypothetical protein [Flavobacterium sp.]|uniref:hypothetical protein n=1 Tax=Flavobacterium sp. TaxID=239 RepID=UPI0025C310D5|nr:hypothetical protein [Flavobacterium sp.]
MRKIFNTPNFLILGIAVASAGLLYLGVIWHCKSECQSVAQEEIVSFPAPDPVA